MYARIVAEAGSIRRDQQSSGGLHAAIAVCRTTLRPDRRRVGYELRCERRETRRSAAAVKKAVKKVGQ